ncbi:MAG: hypothetical protein K9H26_13880 [Prolixibacteraceae bacterium]|nr:hypothetical protein [Prolixibacteraceae bacterium]
MAFYKEQTFKRRILFSYITLFTVFTVVIFLFQYEREKQYKIDQLENTLDNISLFSSRYIFQKNVFEANQPEQLDSLVRLLSDHNVRLTVIDTTGLVLYDSEVGDVDSMENHLQRPEIQKALNEPKGSNIRFSTTTRENYYYYAKYYEPYIVRVAMLYDVEIKNFLKTNPLFIVFIVALFILMWLSMNVVTNRISRFINQLKDISVRAGQGQFIKEEIQFSDKELVTINQQIVGIYNKLNKAKQDLTLEKEKLFQHLDLLKEGVAFYNAKKENILRNNNFVKYINLISDKPSVLSSDIFDLPELKPAFDFVEGQKDIDFAEKTDYPGHSFKFQKNENYFEVRVIVFADKGFEIVLNDISKPEKRRLIKQQLTANIAHELKTPVSSIRGYLETILSAGDIPEDKKVHFVERAYNQSERLSSLLDDVSLLNNIEEGGSLFEFEELDARSLVKDVIENLSAQLIEHKIKCYNKIEPGIKIKGNESLISSVFLNLIENSIRYAGDNITIEIKNYLSDKTHHYFSYTDSGAGIPEGHLSRIFERFYRVDKGRSREKGGTGLGLSIVKNAIQLHSGEISVKNLLGGGIEFNFSLSRS